MSKLSILQNSLVLSLVVAVGLIVLMALHTLSVASGLPIITLLAGVHVGNGVSSTPVSTTPVTGA